MIGQLHKKINYINSVALRFSGHIPKHHLESHPPQRPKHPARLGALGSHNPSTKPPPTLAGGFNEKAISPNFPVEFYSRTVLQS